MKQFLKVAGYIVLSVLLCLYLVFLFVLPRKIDLNVYKPELQKLVKDNTNLDVDFGKVDVITSPFLEAGIKTNDIKVKLPDGSMLFSADSFKGKIFLPSLLWLDVRVSQAEVNEPKLNVEILNGEKYKVGKLYEDIINKRRAERRLKPPFEFEESSQLPFDISIVKLNIPNLKLNNYQAIIDDTKASHKLTLKGDLLKLGYYNGKTAKLKTDAKFLSDESQNITANLDIDTFIPKFSPSTEEEDDDAVFELPFVNPVKAYRDYNLKSNIAAKLKVRQNEKNNKIWAKGFVNIDGTTVTLAGLPLPESSFNLSANGYSFDFDTKLYVTAKEFMKLAGTVDYGKKPYLDLSVKSTQVYFKNLLNITRAYLDTIHIKNDIAQMSASGFLLSNFHVKTDFSNIESDGKFVIRNGNVVDKNIGLLFNDINVNLMFDDNVFKVEDSSVLVNHRPIHISGKVDSNSIANVNILADRIPIPELYLAFAPRELKRNYLLKSGFLTLNTKIVGEIKSIAALFEFDLEKLNIADRNGKFIVLNDILHFGVVNYGGEISGKLKNKGFKFLIPSTNSVLSNDLLVADIKDKIIKVDNSVFKFNKQSKVTIKGEISDYISDIKSKFVANGSIVTSDIKILVGNQIAPYLDSKGAVPLKANLESDSKTMKLIAQMESNPKSYITPVKLDVLSGQKMLIQILAEKNGDALKVYKSGLYVRKPYAVFSDNLKRNLLNAHQIIGIRAMISNFKTEPFINIFKLTIPKDLNGSICYYKKSRFAFGGNLYVFGKLNSPRINGSFNIKKLSIPELMTTVRYVIADLNSNGVRINASDILANGSDFNVNVTSNWNNLFNMRLGDVRVYSRDINVDRLLKVSDNLMKSLPKTSPSSSKKADIPVEIIRGNINLKSIKSGNILVKNTTGRISLFKNILYINNLRAYPLGGNIFGDVSMNLISTELNAKVSGKNFDVEKLLLNTVNMKDTLAGNLHFLADITLKGTQIEEQMKSLKGYVDFSIKNGQLGPFGKFENFLMAENLRENAFFSSAIGSIITDVVTVDTSHFNNLYGHLTFKDGVVNVAPIKSQGNVMSMYIAGKANLLDNSADLKLRGKLASAFSDRLGPLANINPVNLIKNTPGLNIVAAKTFMIFCETVSEGEMNALPPLEEGKSDDYATKFQIVLRGDTRKPLKMIKSFKWLALDSDIEAAKSFVDTMPTPLPGEENMTVEELIQLRAQHEAGVVDKSSTEHPSNEDNQSKSIIDKLKSKLKKDK